jgi:hypothetical protein
MPMRAMATRMIPRGTPLDSVVFIRQNLYPICCFIVYCENSESQSLLPPIDGIIISP